MVLIFPPNYSHMWLLEAATLALNYQRIIAVCVVRSVPVNRVSAGEEGEAVKLEKMSSEV